MPLRPEDIPQLANLYHQYYESQSFLHENFGLRRPLTENEWYNDVVKCYVGPPQNFEDWLWKALDIPQFIRSLPPYEPSAAQPNEAGRPGTLTWNFINIVLTVEIPLRTGIPLNAISVGAVQ
ncbi:hypothetical protein BT96DRAFT_1077089 [Gymnopus androsaceus JB14]|uniref:Uncharacterized protein n=1 Tax=Gymnopus androsaceus JB14 TaxID=1447944 RepID=A0A6A4IIT2_9AGAR|nr:hypothetical protein BT96DRAFT_1077089 [Gymnopus androsaceus JB14]